MGVEIMKVTREITLGLVATAAVFAVSLATTSEAKAQWGYVRSYSSIRVTAPVYRAPSVHVHRVYSPTSIHWTPQRALHTYGHFYYVPPVVPGQVNLYLNGHIHRSHLYHR
jgi:hypothetical protein